MNGLRTIRGLILCKWMRDFALATAYATAAGVEAGLDGESNESIEDRVLRRLAEHVDARHAPILETASDSSTALPEKRPPGRPRKDGLPPGNLNGRATP
jgi:hypothetical protein